MCIHLAREGKDMRCRQEHRTTFLLGFGEPDYLESSLHRQEGIAVRFLLARVLLALSRGP